MAGIPSAESGSQTKAGQVSPAQATQNGAGAQTCAGQSNQPNLCQGISTCIVGTVISAQSADSGTPLLETPSLFRRMACWLYEGMLLFGVVFIAGYLFGTLSQTKNAMDNRHALQAFVFVVFGIYFGWLWSKGQTLAMKTWHIRVVDLKGNALSQGLALKRYLLSWLWVLPPLLLSWWFGLSGAEAVVIVLGWVAVWAVLSRFHPKQQFWHDALAGTQLVTVSTGKR